MLTIIVIVAAMAALASFAWGLRRHFRTEGKGPSGMHALSLFSAVAAVLFGVLMIRDGATPWRGAVSLLLSGLAIALFWWAVVTTRKRPPAVAHTGDTPDMVYDDGPYARVRHPFYLSYCLFWIGTAVAAGGVQWLPSAGLVIWYYVIAKGEEARFSQSGVAGRYALYKARTGMILPRLTGGR